MFNLNLMRITDIKNNKKLITWITGVNWLIILIKNINLKKMDFKHLKIIKILKYHRDKFLLYLIIKTSLMEKEVVKILVQVIKRWKELAQWQQFVKKQHQSITYLRRHKLYTKLKKWKLKEMVVDLLNVIKLLIIISLLR